MRDWSSDVCSSDLSMMTWDDIRSCIQNGFSIGSHSYSHRNLSKVEESELLDTEIALSRQIGRASCRERV